MKKVLITGATGFIGRHCLPLLVERGYDVHAVSSQRITGSEPNVHWHQVDLLDYQQMAGMVARVQPSYLLHFAWYTVPKKYWVSEENISWVRTSVSLLQEFVRHGGKRVVMAGTCAEYDWHYGYCSEAITPLAPTSLYGVCKHALQLMLTGFAKQTGLSAAWGRIFFIFGPHEYPDRLVAYVIRSLLRGELACCSSGSQIRDFLVVQDVADAFVALMESGVVGPVNIASGKPVTLRDVIYSIAKIQNRADLVRLAVLPDRENEPPLLVADVRRLQEEVRWRPKYDLDTALSATINWWAQAGVY